MSPLLLIQNPEMVLTMTISQKIIASVQVMVLGMIVVFFVLFLLMISLNLMEKSIYQKTDRNKDKERDNNDLYAVIASVIIAGYYHGSPEKVKIGKIVRYEEEVPIWGRINRGGSRIKRPPLLKEVSYENQKIYG